jgi:CHASE2 domain-containing sensor protein
VSFDPNYLLASLAVSSVGFVLFRFGRRQQRLSFTVVGVLMLVYPYFVESVGWMLGLVPVLLFVLWLATRMGL